MDFYQLFLKLCLVEHKSPSAVATSLGLSRNVVTGWKKGAKPNDITLVGVANYFGISTQDLFAIDVEKPIDQVSAQLEVLRKNYISKEDVEELHMVWEKEDKEKALEELSQEQRGLLEVTDKMSADDIKLMIEFAKRLKNGH